MVSPLQTSHGSELYKVSAIFACRHCYSPMAFVALPGGTTALECTAPDCGWTCDLTRAELCAVQDDLISVGVAVEAAQHRCRNCGGQHNIQACGEIRAALFAPDGATRMPEGDWLDTDGMRVRVPALEPTPEAAWWASVLGKAA